MREKSVDTILQRYQNEAGPGFAIGIYQSGDVLYKGGFGIAEFEHLSPITPDTKFHIASVSKHFTAFAIGLLQKDGKLRLEDDVRDYLPWLPEFGHTIRVRDLIHHTSGLRDQWMLLNMSGQTFTDHLTTEEILALVSRQRSLNFAPGTDYAYSNTGYTLLAEIVESVTDMTFREYMEAAVFSPLQMTDSVLYDDITETLQLRAHSYERSESSGHWAHARLNYETVGATGLFTTVDDMLKWVANLMQPVVGDTPLIKQMMSTTRIADGRELRYGFGLRQEIIGGHEVWLHGGSDAAFRSMIALVPDRAFAVVILANTPMDRAMLVRELIDAYLNDGEPLAVGEYPQIARPDTETAKSLVGSYITANDPVIRFVLENGQLHYETIGGSRSQVVFREDGTFDLGFPNRHWTYFQIDDVQDGHVTRISRMAPTDPLTTPVHYERFTPVDSSLSPLQEFSGRYYSEELDASYELTVMDGELIGKSFLSNEADTHVPVREDRFESGAHRMTTLQFRRNCNSLVDGFYVTRRRVNRIFFAKAETEQVPECDSNQRN